MQIVDSTNFIKRLYIQEVELKCASSLTDSLAILKNTYNVSHQYLMLVMFGFNRCLNRI